MKPLREKKAIWKGLGSAQQAIARDIPKDGHVRYEFIELCCRCHRLQTGDQYIRRLLNRLIERDIVRRGVAEVPAVGGGTYQTTVYTRGENWDEAAKYYEWSE